MPVAQEKSEPIAGSIAEEIAHWVRSEPALGWFAAQALWMAQPALEIFWPPESIAALAETLEVPPPPAGGLPGHSGEGDK